MKLQPLARPAAFLIASTALASMSVCTPARADLIITGGLELVEEAGEIADGNLGPLGTAIAFDLLGGGSFAPTHTIENVNDGVFGNGSSWIGDSFNSWVGIAWDTPQSIRSFAFGRDNTGQFADRNQGLYIIEVTTSPNVAADPDAAVWSTLGTLDYGAPVGGTLFTQPARRHRYNLGSAVVVTGLRLVAPGEGIASGTAIDEIEVYAVPGDPVDPPSVVTIVNEPGYLVTWDGNDGDHFSPDDPALVPDNAALAANGAAAAASSELGPALNIPFHRASNLNDGLYGNSNSWIGGDGDAVRAAGVVLAVPHDITSIAWGRDNGNLVSDACGGTCTDRSTGTYIVEISEDGSTWMPIASVNYTISIDAEPGGGFTSFLRHEFDVSMEGGVPIRALGVRLIVPTSGLGGGTAIDEIEVYGTAIPTLIATITGPPSGSTINSGEPVNVTASASTDVGTVTKVEFFVDGTPIGEDAEAPYAVAWTPPGAGDYVLTCRATTSTGATAESGPSQVFVRDPIAIMPADGYSLTWDGNDGDFFDPDGPELDGSKAPDNLALASNGAAPFASSELGPELGIDFHVAANLNDGFYGNANSWISASDDPLAPAAFAGIAFPGSVSIDRIAWGRDNGNTTSDACGGTCTDRSLGVYTIQVTSAAMPGPETPDTEWTTIGTVEFLRNADEEPGGGFTAYHRHEFQVGLAGGAPLSATGVRILVPVAGLGGGTAIDEIEIYGVEVDVPFVITGFSVNPDTGEITISWNAEPGKVYALDASFDLVEWEELADGITSPFTSVDFNAPAGTKTRVYRIREL